MTEDTTTRQDPPAVTAARIEAERSRARLMATAQELQERLSPRTLAKGAWEGAKDKGAGLAEDAVDAVRARPITTTGIVAAITMFLAREPLIDLAGRVTAKRKTRKSRKASKQKAPETAQ
jgi:ElaB/YqjD/DUF883 family membrane-anchored ribosome-binding protein